MSDTLTHTFPGCLRTTFSHSKILTTLPFWSELLNGFLSPVFDAKTISVIVFLFDVPPLIWVQIKPAALIGAFTLLEQGRASSEFTPSETKPLVRYRG